MGSLEQFFKIKKGKTFEVFISSNHICIQFIGGIIYFTIMYN